MVDQFVEVFGEKFFLDRRGVLDLRQKKITKMRQIKGIESIKGLKALFLGNKISERSPDPLIARDYSSYSDSELWEKKPSYNDLGEFEVYESFNSLVILDLSYNLSLKSFSVDKTNHLKALKALILRGCWELEWISIRDLPALQLLDLSLCISFQYFYDKNSSDSSPSLKNCPSLREINLSDCYALAELPTTFCKLPKLERLLLGSEFWEGGFRAYGGYFDFKMRLSHLPACIGELTSLKELDLRKCTKLSNLPASIGNLRSLETLDLTESNIKPEGIPISITKLRRVKDLRFNHVTNKILYPHKYRSQRSRRSYTPKKTVSNHVEALKQAIRTAKENMKGEDDYGESIPFIRIISSELERLDYSPEDFKVITELENLIGAPILTHSYRTAGLTVQKGFVQSLQLSNSGLEVLPESIGDLKEISNLILANNNLSALPESIGNLHSLETLNLSNNKLTTLPESLGDLKSLKYLNLSDNKLKALPESIGHLELLETLNLARNRLTNLPTSFGNLNSLKRLDLTANPLRILPESFGHLKSLGELLLEGARLTTLPESFGQLKLLQNLNLAENQLISLPDSFGQMIGLSNLNLKKNQISSLPDCFGLVGYLIELILEQNQLTSLPESFGELKTLKKLTLHKNKLVHLPESFGNLHKLNELTLHHNQLTSLPASFGNLERLRRLNLENNQLSSLPESLGNLKELSILNLQNNQLTHLPNSLEQLRALTTLNLYNNQIEELPECLVTLVNLRHLNVKKNSLSSESYDLIQKIKKNWQVNGRWGTIQANPRRKKRRRRRRN